MTEKTERELLDYLAKTQKAKYQIARALGATRKEAYKARSQGWVYFGQTFREWMKNNPREEDSK